MKINIRNCILCLAIMALTTSCGDFWDGGDPVQARNMMLGRESIDLMVGDSYRIPVLFDPEELSNDGIWWTTDDSDIAIFVDDAVVGMSEGTTIAYAVSAVNRQEAECVVNVWPRWYSNPYNYPYDMVIYANITLNGEPIGDDIYVGAFIFGELRGVAERLERKGHKYTVIRIWSDSEFGEAIYFKHYDPKTATMVEHDLCIPFTLNSYGSPSYPIDIELN